MYVSYHKRDLKSIYRAILEKKTETGASRLFPVRPRAAVPSFHLHAADISVRFSVPVRVRLLSVEKEEQNADKERRDHVCHTVKKGFDVVHRYTSFCSEC